ncbi:MAG TPA: helix-turn-helix domain-containing protein [Stellaceae bacterium]|nr:helix-turn-helix domain-containing protein [Stellaceae bacterium]
MAAHLAQRADTPSIVPALRGPGARGERPDALAALDRVGTVVTLRHDDSLFYEDDAAEYYFKVVTGAVRGCKLLADGRRHVGDFYLAGDFIGLDADTRYIFTAEAVTDTTLVRYQRRSVDALAWQEPGIGRRLLSLACRGLTAAQHQMLLLGRKTADERIASFLLAMAARSGDGEHIVLPMTRTDIGDHLGLTMETVSRALSQLKSAGVIAFKNSHEVVIRDRAQLEDIAETA